MRRLAVVSIVLLIGGCANSTGPSRQQAAPQRELSAPEKAALAPVLAQALKDPAAAKFRWMPVLLVERDGITDYCGLVNGKNGYGGFVRFYAQMHKDVEGQFTSGAMQAIEDPDRGSNPSGPRWMRETCERYGYFDFTLAR